MKIAVLASQNMMPDAATRRSDAHELEEEVEKLTAAFLAYDMQLSLIMWEDIEKHAHEFDAILPLLTWDYFENKSKKFLKVMQRAHKLSHVFNPPEMLAWNMNKAYLRELAQKGVRIIPTLTLELVEEEACKQALALWKCDKIVIKPEIGGGAWRQAVYAKGDNFPSADELPLSRALVQPFLPAVLEEGEYSFLYFGGEFSHALNKRPRQGDYRIQSIYGGTEVPYSPHEEEKIQARNVLDCLTEIPLYARVDFLRDETGVLCLIELEVIEPYLYLPCAANDGLGNNMGAQNFARALARYLDVLANKG